MSWDSWIWWDRAWHWMKLKNGSKVWGCSRWYKMCQCGRIMSAINVNIVQGIRSQCESISAINIEIWKHQKIVKNAQFKCHSKRDCRKYIQVNEFEDEMMEDDNDDEGWNKTLEKEFEESIGWISISGTKQSDDLRLMNAFIARIRWDLAVKDLDKGMLIQSTITPIIKDKLHKIILCGRCYIQQYCERISNGNVMIRRLLMSVGYIDRYLLVWLTEMREEVSYLMFYKRNQAGINMKLYWII